MKKYSFIFLCLISIIGISQNDSLSFKALNKYFKKSKERRHLEGFWSFYQNGLLIFKDKDTLDMFVSPLNLKRAIVFVNDYYLIYSYDKEKKLYCISTYQGRADTIREKDNEYYFKCKYRNIKAKIIFHDKKNFSYVIEYENDFYPDETERVYSHFSKTQKK